ncbi:poly(A)-specific ribonuclease PARN-like [Ruditapes philippinarum]|uniref:poly(A)-specific ribonuclease PARN-like n=1 Tax=Ruditapes philippinarum TaxID=129788 RepID=UPI00295BF4B6|nr:poly(A)-specific ribonuclease PARN-like [Ruditapes philippinarum]
MSNTQPFKDRIDNSGLSFLHHLTQLPPFVKPEVEISEDCDNKYKDSQSLHEAGYDAYITGQCFIALSNFLGQFQQPPSDRVPPSSPLLEPFLNKIFMMRSADIPYMDLVAADLAPSRDHVFHVTFPKDWKHSDISLLFAQFGSVHIGWIDEVSAYVALNSKSVANSVLKTLCKKGSVYRIMSYNDHKTYTRHEHSSQYKWTNQKPEQQSHGHSQFHTPTQTTAPPSGHNLHDGHSAEVKKGTKRSHSPENNGTLSDSGRKKAKSLNVDAPEFQSRITPTSTPEKDESIKWPEDINSSGKKIVILKRPEEINQGPKESKGKYNGKKTFHGRRNLEGMKNFNKNNKNKTHDGKKKSWHKGKKNGEEKKDEKIEKPEFTIKEEDFPPLA